MQHLHSFWRPFLLGPLLAMGPVAAAQDAEQWRAEDGGNGHWYQIASTAGPMNWNDAREHATARGGYLVTVTTPRATPATSMPGSTSLR